MELLRELGPFHYMMNQGNVGDALIAASTVALFEREELNFSSCGPELPAGKEEITLVYGGGGGFVPYFGMLPHYVRLFSDPRLRKCVILPQSFRDCDELVDVLDERFTVFCRERARDAEEAARQAAFSGDGGTGVGQAHEKGCQDFLGSVARRRKACRLPAR